MAEGVADVYISGSNSTLLSSELSSELATLLTGRYIQLPVYPLTYREFLIFINKEKSTKETFNSYLRFGGLPGIHHLELEQSLIYEYINSVFDSIVLKDIVQRNNIRNIAFLEKIVRFIFDNVGQIFSAKKVSDFLKNERRKISVETAFVIYRIPRYDIKGRKILEVKEKYYLGDLGLRHALLGYRAVDIS